MYYVYYVFPHINTQFQGLNQYFHSTFHNINTNYLDLHHTFTSHMYQYFEVLMKSKSERDFVSKTVFNFHNARL